MTIDQQRAIAVAKARLRLQQQAPAISATPSDIPGNYQPAEQSDSRGFLDYAAGIPETALTVATGAVGVPLSAVAGILTGKLGQGPNKQIQEQVMKAVTYQPQSDTARDILSGIGSAVSGIPPYLGTMGAFRPAPAINALRNEAQMARDFQIFPEQAAQRQQRLITQSYENANLIDAANAAKRLGVAINPAVSNPNKTNRFVATVAGVENLEKKLSQNNSPQWTREAKKDMGLSPNTTLNQQAFDQARLDPLISKPYDTVRNLGLVKADEDIATKINALKDEALIVSEKSHAKVSKLVDENLEKLNAGISGQELLKKIQILRQSAQRIYKSEEKGITAPSPESIAIADASMGLANQLEDAASLYLTGSEARSFQNARTLLAKTYDYERATDLRTGLLDPVKFAKITEGKPLTGTSSDIATVAANFPTIAQTSPGEMARLPTFTRAGAGGAVGFGLGSLFGAPYAGSVVGGATGLVANALMAKRMSSPAYQAAHAIPPDYRTPVNMLRPVEPGSSNLALFNPENAVVGAEYRPNFIFQEPPPAPRSAYEAAQQALREEALRRTGSLSPDMQPANLPPQLPPPSMESVVQSREYQKAYENISRSAAEAAAVKAAGPNKSAGAGVAYELDPFTGKLRPVGEQVKGPETFTALQENAMMRDFQYVEQLKAELENLKGSKNRAKQNEIKRQIQEIEFFYSDKMPNFLVKRGRNENYGSSEAFTGPPGLRNITPQFGSSIITSRQTALESAIEKVKRGELVTLTAEEKIALRDLQKQNKLAP